MLRYCFADLTALFWGPVKLCAHVGPVANKAAVTASFQEFHCESLEKSFPLPARTVVGLPDTLRTEPNKREGYRSSGDCICLAIRM
jgi:hypothetical protein